MKIAIGSDHGGFELKEKIKSFLKGWHYEIKDFGTHSEKRCDYPIIGYKVASGVAKGNFDRGILICKSGIGMCIVANKVSGIRGALLTDLKSACFSRQHNDANVAILSGSNVAISEAKRMLEVWLSTEFEGGRHKKRIDQIKKIEKMENRSS